MVISPKCLCKFRSLFSSSKIIQLLTLLCTRMFYRHLKFCISRVELLIFPFKYTHSLPQVRWLQTSTCSEKKMWGHPWLLFSSHFPHTHKKSLPNILALLLNYPTSNFTISSGHHSLLRVTPLYDVTWISLKGISLVAIVIDPLLVNLNTEVKIIGLVCKSGMTLVRSVLYS